MTTVTNKKKSFDANSNNDYAVKNRGVDGVVNDGLTQIFEIQNCSTGNITSVADTNTSTTLIAANVSRKGLSICNTSTVNLYILCSSGTASITNLTAIVFANGYWESPFGYTGIVVGVWASDPGTGAALITEYT